MDKKMKLVLDIMQLGVEISKNTKTDVFVNYAGHVDQLSIRIYEDGWENSNEHYDRDIYLDTTETRTEENIIYVLEEIYFELEELK